MDQKLISSACDLEYNRVTSVIREDGSIPRFVGTVDYRKLVSKPLLIHAIEHVQIDGQYVPDELPGVIVATTSTSTTPARVAPLKPNPIAGLAIQMNASNLNWSPQSINVTTRGFESDSGQSVDRNVSISLRAIDAGVWFYFLFGTFDQGEDKNGRVKVSYDAGGLSIIVANLPTAISGVNVRLCSANTSALDELCSMYDVKVM
jgi:hypothetical protein